MVCNRKKTTKECIDDIYYCRNNKKNYIFIENKNNLKNQIGFLKIIKYLTRAYQSGLDTMVFMIIGLINKEGYYTYTLKSG
jgi:hypothetical protein